MSSTRDAEKKINENIDNASHAAQEEVTRLRAELDDLRRKARPKMKEAESYLTSPTAIGFYQGRFGFGAGLETRLARPNVKLEELFEDDQLLHQVQLQNPKLIDFLRRPYVLSQLINYMLQTPQPDQTKAVLACEILAAGVPALMDSLVFNHPELLTVFWALLDQPYTLDTQLTYFCKVNRVLLIKRPGDMLRFIQSQPDIVQKWIKHLNGTAGPYLSDLLMTLIQCEQHSDGVGVVQMHAVAQQVLCDLISHTSPPHKLLDNLIRDDLFENLLCVWSERLDRLLSILDNPRSGKNKVETTIGIQEQLGRERLAACELLAELVFCANHAVQKKSANTFKEVLIEQDALRRFVLLSGSRLVERILEVYKENESAKTKSGLRLGYMGHLTLISKDIIKLLHTHGDIRHTLEGIPWDDWESYVDQLVEQEKQKEIPLGSSSTSEGQIS
ncbi:Serine/threonine-protein phosphatase 6 regulatory subunit 3 [Apophysomyces ossiformis]|uniref:Serine/threonine-protein phosphatase 6 regulatory subunit 3 n=1 Tax=Apophysomyces ossiformis TaxID=679940 RepID=A0A8H7BG83_9FUNG|nr:Serine/threonine-protein phosphatase 6 regulatory subunit 3 [Apophysomyces ossiformis]